MDTLSEARAFLLLQGLPDVADRSIEALVSRFGSGSAALSAPRAEFAEVVGSDAERARRAPGPHARRVDRALAWAARTGTRVVVRGGPGYPPRLLDLADPPPVLFLRGDASLLDRPPRVAVVGSRRCTGYGRRVAADVSTLLVHHGVGVVSGLALGVDAVAHRATLEAGGATVAVLGTGPDVLHPRSNAGLFRRIARDGLLVSEFLPGTPALPHHFPRRNRILAALARAVVVVEAAEKSGTLTTVRHALDLGIDVLAVPGPIYAVQSEGTNQLIRDGAILMSRAELVLEHVSGLDPGSRRGPRRPVSLPPDARALWVALEPEPVTVDELSRRAGIPAGRALAALSDLELGGWARREPGMRFLRIAG